jgi:hypothetical protein
LKEKSTRTTNSHERRSALSNGGACAVFERSSNYSLTMRDPPSSGGMGRGTSAPVEGASSPPASRGTMSDTKLMTYAEIADALGIGADSARNLVRRKRWHRRPGNDGLARVEVPVEYVAEHEKADAGSSPPASPPVEPPASPPADVPADGGIIQTLNRHIERLGNCQRRARLGACSRDTPASRGRRRSCIASDRRGAKGRPR